MEERKYADLRLDVDQDDKLATEVTINGNKITPPKNYLIGKITKVDNGMLVEFVKKQPQYPKTYMECCEVLRLPSQNVLIYDNFECSNHDYFLNLLTQINQFTSLKICRDAYWKIAGKQLGLDKPWEPDYTKDRYIIRRAKDEILKGYNISSVLEFPTEEMRDAFFENFKDLIEKCKELL